MLPLSVALSALYWHQDQWDKHPIATQLAELSSGGSWRAVAAAIDTEFRRVDKFASGSVCACNLFISLSHCVHVFMCPCSCFFFFLVICACVYVLLEQSCLFVNESMF